MNTGGVERLPEDSNTNKSSTRRVSLLWFTHTVKRGVEEANMSNLQTNVHRLHTYIVETTAVFCLHPHTPHHITTKTSPTGDMGSSKRLTCLQKKRKALVSLDGPKSFAGISLLLSYT